MPSPPSLGAVTSPFGMRVHPITGVYRMHFGEDTIGDGNFAPVSGTVVFAGYDTTGYGLGLAVGIRETARPDRIWWSGHHARLDVKVGYKVIERRTRIGLIGRTGAASGIHCHQECRVGGTSRPVSGTAINPRPLYVAGGGGGGGGINQEDTMSAIIKVSKAGTPTFMRLAEGGMKVQETTSTTTAGRWKEDIGWPDTKKAITGDTASTLLSWWNRTIADNVAAQEAIVARVVAGALNVEINVPPITEEQLDALAAKVAAEIEFPDFPDEDDIAEAVADETEQRERERLAAQIPSDQQ